MKINRFGINLDEGIALTEENLDKFYVSCFEDDSQKIIDWLKDDTIETPLLFGGQIGSGKSTLITKVFSEKRLKPDITLKFYK
jgi:putative ribosome biogenesis GTPase RsgA